MGIRDRGAVISANRRVALILADVKYECSPDQCEKLTEGFQAAEYFGYSPSTGKLSTCLWTNCYAGMATVFKNNANRTLTAIGQLAPTTLIPETSRSSFP
jgi:hypothetical protein